MRSILRRLSRLSKKRLVRIVFLCTANCTRSPFAEILFERLLIQAAGSLSRIYEKNIIIESAGIFSSGYPISERSREILVNEEGISESRCDSHRGRGIAGIDEPDLVLAMEAEHVLETLRLFPAWKGKVYMLDRFVHEDNMKKGQNIDDPTGLSIEDYKMMKRIIKTDLLLLLDEFREVGLI